MTYFFSEADAGDNCLVNIFPIKDALIAATETMKVQQIDPETLDTLPLVRSFLMIIAPKIKHFLGLSQER